ncbi:MAG: hypothetical protein ACPLIG_03895 [Candidatus Bathyarchaeales archaeon]
MLKRNSVYCVVYILLTLVVLCSSMLTVIAETSDSMSTIGTWQPPKNFIDPVTLKIQEFKSQGLTDEEITVKLAELGMGWYPKTGATWMGRTLTSEEQAKMPVRKPAKALADQKSATSEETVLQLTGRTSCMRTSTASWTGVASEIVSGSMSVATGQTQFHYLCMQLGNLDDASNWVETVLTHNLGETYRWHTYDNDEGGWAYYMDKNTPITAADTYVIMLDGMQDGDGWHYDVWINYQWARRGHLSNLQVQAGFQKEVYSNTGTFTNDASHVIFYRNWLHNAGGWTYWTTPNTWWSTAAPVREDHSMGAVSYRWETWVQN